VAQRGSLENFDLVVLGNQETRGHELAALESVGATWVMGEFLERSTADDVLSLVKAR
jgi:hypothetical protein